MPDGCRAVACRRRGRHHPALRAPLLEGGECLGVVNVCGKTVHPSPATLASSEAVAAPPASRPEQRFAPPLAVGEQRPVTPASSLDSGTGTSWRAGEQRPITPASSLDSGAGTSWRTGEQRPVTPASSLGSGTGTSWRAGEERPVTSADSAGPATFPSSQEGWPKAGVVGPRRPSGRRRHHPHVHRETTRGWQVLRKCFASVRKCLASKSACLDLRKSCLDLRRSCQSLAKVLRKTQRTHPLRAACLLQAQKKVSGHLSADFCCLVRLSGGRSDSNRRPTEPQSGTLTN